MAEFYSGAFYPATLPEAQRTYYEQVLLATLRAKNIFVRFCSMVENFAGADTGQITYTEVMDTVPNWNALLDTDLFLTGAHIDSRKITIDLDSHGDVLKFHDRTELVNYWNSGDFTGLVAGKLGQNMVDYLDILAMNAYLSAPVVSYAGTATSRFDLAADDLYNPELGALARLHLEENFIPGVASVQDGDGQTVLALTSPRAIYDFTRPKQDGSESLWWSVEKYANPELAMRFEAGAWDGVRYVKSPRLKLPNYGRVQNQTTFSAPSVVGQGSIASHQGYSVGQGDSTRYIEVADSSGFSVGDVVTIHSQNDVSDDGAGGKAPNRSDGTQENVTIAAIDSGGANRLTFTRPLMKPHSSGDYVTKGIDLGATIVMGGPAVVYAVGERPNIVIPPKYDDLMRINRIGWRGFLKFQMFRPEWVEVIWSAVSTN